MILLLAGCAPLITGAVPTPLPAGQQGEVGVTGHGGHVPVHVRDGLDVRQAYPTLGGTLYARAEFEDGVGIGTRIDLGPTQYLAAGAWVRIALHRRSNSYVGVQVEGGWAYAELSIPAAFRVGRKVWFWVRPGARGALVPMGLLPVGMSFRLGETFSLHTEVVAMTPVLMDGWAQVNPIGLTGGLGVSTHF